MKKYLLLLFAGLLPYLSINAQSLVSASPNTVQAGATLTTTITGAGTYFTSSSPQGYVGSVYIQQGASTYYADFFTGILATDDTHVDAVIAVPGTAPIGAYDLHVEYYDQGIFYYNLVLPASVTVNPADGYIQGKVFDDANANGIQDGGESGLAGESVNITTYGNVVTDANGDFSAGVANGNYTVSYVTSASNYLYVPSPYSSSYNVTLNNDTIPGNNFATGHKLTSIYPDSAIVGQSVTITITGKKMFDPGSVPATYNIYLQKIGGALNIACSQVTYVDSSTIKAKFIIPSNVTYVGNYNLRIYTFSVFNGYHYLNNVFKVIDFPVYMNGIVFYDTDSNGIKGPGEVGLSGGKLLLTPDSSYAYSDQNGDYSLGTFPGTHTITWINPNPYVTLSQGTPPSYTATVATTTSGYDFGVTSNYPLYADSITLGACWSGCHHPNFFYITYQNIGGVAYDGYVYMVLDSNNMYPSTGAGTQPDSIIGDTLFWNFTNLQPFQPVTITPYINTPTGGDTISYSVTMVALNPGGAIAYTSTDNNTHVVNCSMDPNEKHVQPEGIMAQHYTLKTDELLYSILFQNTGTDTAYTVVIRDTIDSNLDLNTLEVFSSSHVVNTEISLLTRVAKFTFDNILLVDSNHNEAASHGFVRYSIRAKQGVADNTIVYNNAGIYFDFNAPVITNTTYNTLVTTLPVGIPEHNIPQKGGAVVIPNPFTEVATLVFENSLNELYDVNIYSVTGKLLQHMSTNQNSVELHRNKLSAGIYFYELKNKVSSRNIKGKFVIN